MALTQSAALAAQLGLVRSHGITRNPSSMTKPIDGPWYYEQVALGFNYRMTDMQAALGTSQMTRLNEFVKRSLCCSSVAAVACAVAAAE